jgi:hypothetical protein
MANDAPLLFVPVGSNSARLFGMDARTRACRLAANAGFDCADAPAPGQPALVASLDYAWDPAWLKGLRARPKTVRTLGGEPVMAHVPAGDDAAAVCFGLTGFLIITGWWRWFWAGRGGVLLAFCMAGSLGLGLLVL